MMTIHDRNILGRVDWLFDAYDKLDKIKVMTILTNLLGIFG